MDAGNKEAGVGVVMEASKIGKNPGLLSAGVLEGDVNGAQL